MASGREQISWVGWWRGRVAVLLGLMLGLGGCASLGHRLVPLASEDLGPVLATHPEARTHVYTFLINGNDPLLLGNFPAVQQEIFRWGFPHTWYGEMYHVGQFEREIRQIHQRDPDARVVLVGFSYGGMLAQRLARRLARDGIHINRLILIDAFGVDEAADAPEGYHGRTVNISGESYFQPAQVIEDGENIQVPEYHHFAIPTHASVLHRVSEELAAAAQEVPVWLPARAEMFPAGPVPRPHAPEPPPLPREWDFLQPTYLLELPVPVLDVPAALLADRPDALAAQPPRLVPVAPSGPMHSAHSAHAAPQARHSPPRQRSEPSQPIR